MYRTRSKGWSTRTLVLSLAAALTIVIVGCEVPGGQPSERPVAPIMPDTVTVLRPRAVKPQDLRWCDLTGQPYSQKFQHTFHYDSQVRVVWQTADGIPRGLLQAKRLKPNFAYQVKLVGRKPITSAEHAPLPTQDPEGWASWQLGHRGRWWCPQEGWNVGDWELANDVKAGKSVYGYLLFGFFITDSEGNATLELMPDNSYHVLWRTDQRTPEREDSPVLKHEMIRGQWGYEEATPADGGTVGIFAEHETDRPAPGHVRLPAGTYSAFLNITEESFHDNLSYTNPGGGFWAQVLEAPIHFTVAYQHGQRRAQISPAAGAASGG